jgi:hypothetical protein
MCVCSRPAGSPHQGLGHTGMGRRFRAKHRCSICSMQPRTERAAHLTRNPSQTSSGHGSMPCASPSSPFAHTFSRPLSRGIRRCAGPVSAARMHAPLAVACQMGSRDPVFCSCGASDAEGAADAASACPSCGSSGYYANRTLL